MKIAIVDFVSMYSDAVGECLSKLNIEHDYFKHDVKYEEIKDYDGLIFTGSLDTVYQGGRLPDKSLLDSDKPIFGICYGHQLIHYLLGGEVKRSNTPELGIIEIEAYDSALFKDLPTKQKVKMHHNDEVVKMAEGFKCIASEKDCLIAASENRDKKIYTVQFHPEAEGNDYGLEIFKNFIEEI